MTTRVLYSFPHTMGTVGINSTAWWQVKSLLDNGLEVTVFCSSLARDLGTGCEVVETLSLGGRRVPHRALGSVGTAYRYHDWRVERALARMAPKVDLVHCWPAACLRTLARARQLGVVSFREAPSAHTETAFRRATEVAAALGVRLPRSHPLRFDRRALAREKAEFELSDVILVPSTFAERTFIDSGVPAERLTLHQYGFDPALFAPETDSQVRSGGRPFTAVFVGRGEPNKGLHLALRAWIDSGAAEHGRFIVCGRILPSYRSIMSPILNHPSVEARGYVDDIPAVLRGADVLILPSLTEGSALVTYEAQGSGCVLLVSEATGARCHHEKDALVHPSGDVATLTEQLRMLVTDRALLARLRAATIAGRDELNWHRAGDSLIAAYNLWLERRTSMRAATPGERPIC